MFMAVTANRKHLPWLIAAASLALLAGLGVMLS